MVEPDELKRGRGRPKGASCLNEQDSQTLSKVADEVLTKSITPTTAMRWLGIHEEATTRRLQRKWKKDGPRYLEAAHERRQKARSSPEHVAPGVGKRAREVAGYVPSSWDRLYDRMNSPGMPSFLEQVRMAGEGLHAQRAMDLALQVVERPLVEVLREMEARDRQFQDMKAMMEMPTIQKQMEQMEQIRRAFQPSMELFRRRTW